MPNVYLRNNLNQSVRVGVVDESNKTTEVPWLILAKQQIGPFKEQRLTQYTRRLAMLGYITYKYTADPVVGQATTSSPSITPSADPDVVIGFDKSEWPNIRNWSNADQIKTFIKDDTSKLDNISTLFAGEFPDNQCGDVIFFDQNDWSKVKSFIEGGGRVYLALEHSNNCLPASEQTKANNFFDALGSSIDYVQNSRDRSGGFATVGSANLAQGLSVGHDRVGEVSGGTSVLLDSGGNSPYAAIENLGSGYLIVVAESNIVNEIGDVPTPNDNNEFFNRIVNYDDAQLI